MEYKVTSNFSILQGQLTFILEYWKRLVENSKTIDDNFRA